ncbi:MAG TPA: 2-oxo acid dehydrogenase subunit E2 [Urbifossiella sp.]|nr:2-oxo acid dehydrogenase subunit E2 [Urbifossiella sp.]
MDFRLPSLGEGIDSATVTAVLVKPGDAVAAGQNVISVETDKASMDVEADAAGTVEAVLVKQGDKLTVGAPVLRFAGAGAKPAALPSQPPAASRPAPAPPAAKPQAATQAPAPTGSSEFRLPNLGEGIEAATVTAVLVKPGDVVKPGTPVASVETDKASMDVEADAAGTVEAVLVKQGDKLTVGAPMLRFAGAAPSQPLAASRPAPAPPAAKPQAVTEPPAPHANGAPAKTADVVPAGPATRRLARELGVALGELKGSGRGGRVTLDDIKGFVRDERQKVKTAPAGVPPGKTVADSFTTPPLPDFSKYGEVERKPVAKIRETIAKNLTVAWRTMPMVTQHDLADITDLEAGRKRVVDSLPKGSPKITMTVLAVKACVAALRDFPQFNSSYDMNAGELVLKKYFHVGIAVDTDRGLVVPVVKDADKKSIRDIAAEVVALAEKARAGKLGIDDMRGGTFTITNLGGIGGTSFTPIVNYPEVAILGLSRSALQPVVKDGEIVPRLMMPLSLTYDHRVVDGAAGARFTSRLAQLFSDPLRLLMDS